MDPLRVKYHKDTKFNDDADWAKFYGEVKEEDPHNMPDPLGVPVKTSTYSDLDHAGNKATRTSHTSISIFVQNALIIQYSKKQNILLLHSESNSS
jgi:hypothetical protein